MEIRVDPAHAPEAHGSPAATTENSAVDQEPLLQMLRAIAGREASAAEQQGKRHAQELIELLELQHSAAEVREAELQQQLFELERESRRVRSTLGARERELQAHMADPPPQDPQPAELPRLDEVRDRWRETLERNYRETDPETADQTLQHLASLLSRSRQELLNRERVADEWWDTRHHELALVSRELAGRRRVLEELHGDAERLFRESMEMRLVSEELWAQVVAAVPPRWATEELGKLRARLRAQLEASEARLESRRQEIAAATAEMREQQQSLEATQQQMLSWIESRHQQLDQHVQRVAARERRFLLEAGRHQR